MGRCKALQVALTCKWVVVAAVAVYRLASLVGMQVVVDKVPVNTPVAHGRAADRQAGYPFDVAAG